jgi:hypothetical protein
VVHDWAGAAFFHGFSAANYVAAAVAAMGALIALAFLPAHPTSRPLVVAAAAEGA